MRLFFQSLVFLLFVSLCLLFSSTLSFAATTPYRSAGTVTTDGFPYTNLGNCTQTDGLTCDRGVATLFSNLYLSNFGSYSDFGIPQNATITAVHIRMTGKTSVGIYAGLFYGSSACYFLSDLWTFYGLVGSTIKTQTATTLVTPNGDPHTVQGRCVAASTLPNVFWRINYSSGDLWSASIDNFEVAFDYTVPPQPTKTPVIFIPGIGGSGLKARSDTQWSEDNGHGGTYIHSYNKDETVWVNTLEAAKPGDDDYFDVLRMKPDGTSQADIGINGEVLSAYQPAIDFFIAHGYELNKSLFVFPYDWRQDVANTVSLLDEKINVVKQQTGTAQVSIVAHSMGGLVARNYIADPTRAHNVKQLFTLGTPHLGAVDSLKTNIYGDCLTDAKLEASPYCIGIPPLETKDVVHNMISGYELTPSQTYFTFYTGDTARPYAFSDQRDMDGNGVTGPLNYDETKELLTNLGENTSLFGPSEALHALDTQLAITNGVTVTNIAGSGMPTLGQIIEKNLIDFLGVAIPQKDMQMIDGDGTVPLYSAFLIDPERGHSLLGNATIYYTKQTHGDLVTAGPALNLVLNKLEGSTALPTGVATEPYTLNGTLLSVHSPVMLDVYDANGNHTGPTEGSFEEGIPSSIYTTLDDAKFVFLPQEGTYHVRFTAAGEGSFDFKIRKFEHDRNTETLRYAEVPLQRQTRGETNVTTTLTDSPILSMDEDGDGTFDQEVNVTTQVLGTANEDSNPPQSTVTLQGTQGHASWFTGPVTVTLSATDDASGVSKILYTADNGQTTTLYTRPFALTADGITTLKFRAVDLAGNEEVPQEKTIRIDKTPPEATMKYNTTGELVVVGNDATQTTTTILPSETKQYRIEDEAGNTLMLSLEERETNNSKGVSVLSLLYNNQQPFFPDENIYKLTYQGKIGNGIIQDQLFQVGENQVKISYNKEKDQSTIITSSADSKKTKEVENGLIRLFLTTYQGNLLEDKQ